MDLKMQVDKIITDIWLNDLREDYLNGYLLLEDSLKSAFYYHLRRKFEEKGLYKKGLHIYTEFTLSKASKLNDNRVDIAIIKPKYEQHFKYTYWHRSFDYIALIELKFKLEHYKTIRAFMNDIFKVIKYGEKFKDTLLYACSIHEKDWNHHVSWLDNIPIELEEKAKNVTELIGYWHNDGEFFMERNKIN